MREVELFSKTSFRNNLLDCLPYTYYDGQYYLKIHNYLVSFADIDKVVPRPGMASFHASTKSLDKGFVEYDKLYHEIFNEPRTPAIPQVISWFKQRMANDI